MSKQQVQDLLDDAKQHVEYLQSTLIPDLIESGRDFTAEDFQHCCGLIVRLSEHVKRITSSERL